MRLRNLYLRALTAAAVFDSYRRLRAALSEAASCSSVSDGASRPDESATYSYSSSMPSGSYVSPARPLRSVGVSLEFQCQFVGLVFFHGVRLLDFFAC